MANERVILRLEDAKFLQDVVNGIFELTKDGMTTKQKAPYFKTLSALKDTIRRSEEYDKGTYFQESLKELDDDY